MLKTLTTTEAQVEKFNEVCAYLVQVDANVATGSVVLIGKHPLEDCYVLVDSTGAIVEVEPNESEGTWDHVE